MSEMKYDFQIPEGYEVVSEPASEPEFQIPDGYEVISDPNMEPEPPKIETFEDKVLSIPGMKPLAEVAAAANKSIFEFVDFLGPNNVNAVLDLIGADTRMGTLTETLGSDGGYMEEGVGRDAAQALGRALPMAASLSPVAGRDITTMRGAAEEIMGLGSAKVVEPVKAAAQQTAETIGNNLPSKAREAAKLPLYRGDSDIVTAGFKLDDTGRVINDNAQKKALKAGLDEGLVPMIANSNTATKKRLREMVEVLEKGKSNLEYRNFNPPQKVVGEAITDRLTIIQRANKEAADQLDAVASNLEGQPIDVSPAVDRFMERLAGERIRLNPATGSLNFQGSTIEGQDLRKAQGILMRVVRRLHGTNDPSNNALRVHDAKKFIDEQVSFGRSQAGLSGRMEGIVKELRHNLDGILDRNFPEYDRINTMYSETRDVIDNLQGLAGNKVDLSGDNVSKALGVMSRKVLSNYSSGTATEDIFKQLDDVSKRYSTPLSGGTDDELLKLVSAEAEIRKMFSTAIKPNTFQGEIGNEVMRGAAELAAGDGKMEILKKAGKAVTSVFSKSEDEKLKALKELLIEKP